MKAIKIKMCNISDTDCPKMFKLKCYKLKQNGVRDKLGPDINITLEEILDGIGENEPCVYDGVINIPDTWDDWNDVINKAAPDGFFYDMITATYLSASDVSKFNNALLIEKCRMFAGPSSNIHYETKSWRYLIYMV